MLRWLVRLLVLAAIAAAAAMVVSRLTNREEDFDDYDDLDAGFDFQETPVEIEVPAKQSAGGDKGAAQTGGGDAAPASASTSGSGSGSSSDSGAKANGSGEGSSMDTSRLSPGDNLTDIVGIGPAYDTRLKAIGINTLADLSHADANSLSEQIDVIGGVATLEDWIAQAKNLASGETSNGQG